MTKTKTKSSQKGKPGRQRSYAGWIAAISVAAAVALAAMVYRAEGRAQHAPVIEPTGRSDASQVLDPARFGEQPQQQSYAVARKIPAVLNQLFCWCGCRKHSGHRSLLECFESDHASHCDICMGEAMVANAMVQRGVTNAREIQAAIDDVYGPGRRRT